MSSISWKGGAAAVAQVQTYAFAGTWEATDVVRCVIGNKTVSFVGGSTTITTAIDTIVTAWLALDASVYPEFAEITPSRSSTTLTLTAVTAGKPFTCTITPLETGGGAADAQTIEGAGTATTGTAATASSGPEDVSTAANWSAGAIPVNTDTVTVDLEGARLKYGLDQNGITLTALNITAKDVEIGLPVTNADAAEYPEYRATSWKISATTVYTNTKSGRLKLNFGTAQTAYTQDASGTGRETNIPPVLLQGTHASNVWNFFGGQAGLAFFAGDTFTATTLRLDDGATVFAGSACAIATANNFGGTLTMRCAASTALNHPGTGRAITRVEGSGAVAQVTLQGGQLFYNTTGTLGGNTVLGGTASMSFDEDQQVKTVTNPILIYSPSVQFSDAFASITGGYTLHFVNCIGTIKLKPNSSIVVAAL